MTEGVRDCDCDRVPDTLAVTVPLGVTLCEPVIACVALCEFDEVDVSEEDCDCDDDTSWDLVCVTEGELS